MRWAADTCLAQFGRFNRTLLDEKWAHLKPYSSNQQPTQALTDFLHTYNHHCCPTALDGRPPISRETTLQVPTTNPADAQSGSE